MTLKSVGRFLEPYRLVGRVENSAMLPDFFPGIASGLFSFSLNPSRLSRYSRPPPSRPMKDKLSEKRKGTAHWTMLQNQEADLMLILRTTTHVTFTNGSKESLSYGT